MSTRAEQLCTYAVENANQALNTINEEIQAQRNPNLKKLHSELAIKSHHNTYLTCP